MKTRSFISRTSKVLGPAPRLPSGLYPKRGGRQTTWWGDGDHHNYETIGWRVRSPYSGFFLHRKYAIHLRQGIFHGEGFTEKQGANRMTRGLNQMARSAQMAMAIGKRAAKNKMDRRWTVAAGQYGVTLEEMRAVLQMNNMFFNRHIIWNLVEMEPLIFRCLMEHVIDELGAVRPTTLRSQNLLPEDVV